MGVELDAGAPVGPAPERLANGSSFGFARLKRVSAMGRNCKRMGDVQRGIVGAGARRTARQRMGATYPSALVAVCFAMNTDGWFRVGHSVTAAAKWEDGRTISAPCSSHSERCPVGHAEGRPSAATFQSASITSPTSPNPSTAAGDRLEAVLVLLRRRRPIPAAAAHPRLTESSSCDKNRKL